MIGHQRRKENVEKVKAKTDRLDWTEMESNQENVWMSMCQKDFRKKRLEKGKKRGQAVKNANPDN